MPFPLLLGALAAVWLASLAACALAFRWSCRSVHGRFWPAVALCLAALALGCLGLTRFRFVASRTVNQQIEWQFDSRWLFATTLVLGSLTLIHAAWKHRRISGTS